MRHRFPLIIGFTVFAVAIMQLKKGEPMNVGAELDVVQQKAEETQKKLEDKIAFVQDQLEETAQEETLVTRFSLEWFKSVSQTMAENNNAVSQQTSLSILEVARSLTPKEHKLLLSKVVSNKTTLHEKKLAYYLLEHSPSTPAKYLKKISKSHQMLAGDNH